MLVLPIETERGFYLYSGWSNRIFQVSRQLFSPYASGSWDDRLKAMAIRSGLLPETSPTVEIFCPELIAEAIDELKQSGPEMLVLSITEECNFRCDYCYYSGAYSDSRGHSGNAIDLCTASKAIEWYFGFPREEYKIGFYGGEPLLHVSLLRELVAFAEQHKPEGSRVTFALTTNGSLLSDNVCDFLAAKEVETYVSIDGPEAVHDRYRHTVHGNPTFGTVLKNLRRFKSLHPDYFDRQVNYTMTIAPPNPLKEILSFMNDNAELFGEKIPSVSTVRLLSGDDGPLPLSAEDAALDFSSVWESFIESSLQGKHPKPLARAVCEAAVRKIHRRQMSDSAKIVTTGGQCTPGKRCYVDTDGGFHMCERVNAFFPIGSVRDGYDFERIGDYLRRYSALVGSRCSDCWAVRLCQKCVSSLADKERLSDVALDAFCSRHKKALAFGLTQYCRAREQRNDCFDWIGQE